VRLLHAHARDRDRDGHGAHSRLVPAARLLTRPTVEWRAPMRVRVLPAIALVLAAAVLAGCQATGSRSQTVSGHTLRVYTSLPLTGDLAARAADVKAAEELALSQAHG